MKRISFLWFFCLILSPYVTWAYPEMIRHGYVNCMACHTTSQGGDLLSPYGRELSKEILSRNDSFFKKEEKEKNYWEVQTPDWLTLGANVRLLQTFSESSLASKGMFLIMQVDLDAAVKISDQVLFYGSLGRYESDKADADWKDFIYSPRVWVRYAQQWREGAEMATLRLGRFFPIYGINIPEHTYVTRRNLEFNPGQERISAELAWNNENYQIFVTGLLDRANYMQYDSEKGYVAQISKVFGKTTRVGINIYRSKLTQSGVEQNKAFEGAFAIIGWNQEFSSLVQLDRIYNPNGKTGFLDLFKLSYEYTQGINFFATQEYFNADTEKTEPHYEAYGVGIQYFPMPNFNLFATYKKQKDSAQLDEFQNIAWIISQLYF